MDHEGIESVLSAAEQSLAEGGSLSGTGFLGIVSRVKKDPELAERYGARIARIDDTAFRRWPMLVIPILPGTVLAVVAALVGVFLVGWTYRLVDSGNQSAALVSFFAGFVALLGSTHGLGHLLVGRLVGIRFTSWFVAGITRPQPGVKVDYDTYLRSTPRRRASMHAAGAITTKLIPFVLIGAASVAGLPNWVIWLLIVLGVLMIATDIFWSTKASDWSRVRRELRG